MLAELVAKGELPPVDQRLPENPAVVEPIKSIGKYGGIWRRMTLGTRDIQLDTRMGYEPLVRWDSTGKKVVPGLAEDWKISDGGRTYTFHLRKGLRWSDGHPLTSEDFAFYFQDVLGNKELSPIFPAWLVVGGEPVQFSAPDECTLVFTFAEPFGVFLEGLAYRGHTLVHPKHYLKQFHPHYVAEEELQRRAEQEGANHWRSIYGQRSVLNVNPDLPTCKAFRLITEPPASLIIAERNPYYWKVDPEGNQLPYIDQIRYTDVQNNEVVTMKAMNGDVDFQARRIDASSYPVFMESREKGQYRVMRDLAPDTVCLYVNQYSKDPELRPILQDARFRIALSLAVNREELISVLYSGMAVPSRGGGVALRPVLPARVR